MDQAVARGPVPESEWSKYTYNLGIRKKLEEIVRANAYAKDATFHPLDPFELMAVLRYGDLNAVELIMEIEEAYGIRISDDVCRWLIDEKVPFIDFINYIEERAG